MLTVTETMIEECANAGLDTDNLGAKAAAVLNALTPALDNAMISVGDDPQALRVFAAALRSYARVSDQYAAGLDAQTG